MLRNPPGRSASSRLPSVAMRVEVGLLGGFTTFSTFGLDSLLLARNQPPAYAIANIVGQVAGGLLAVWIGYRIGGSSTA